MRGAVGLFLGCVLLSVLSAFIASLAQKGFGSVEVEDVGYSNYNGIAISAKIFRPARAGKSKKVPGIMYVHGYQSCRETSDPFSIELARRGFAVLAIDAVGRGNSGTAMDLSDPDFDHSYGAKSSLAYLRALPYVDTGSIGVIGHSLGAGIIYEIALHDSTIGACVTTGFGYTEDVSPARPRNMLMIYGQWDEFRKRMTGTKSFVKEWMALPRTEKAFGLANPEFNTTYGDFSLGTARRVVALKAIHITETHSRKATAEAVLWMKQALAPDKSCWIEADNQVWQIREWMSLVAMVACFASLMPLGLMLLRLRFFRSIALIEPQQYRYFSKGKAWARHVFINGILTWLYLPLILVLFAIHKFIVPVDTAFPLMVVNGIAWWFLITGIIGLFLFRRWYRKNARQKNLSLDELGISCSSDRLHISRAVAVKSLILAFILFCVAYATEHIIEALFIIDFRFIFSYASDLTPYRALLWAQYAPVFLAGFIGNGLFLHVQARRAKQSSWQKSFIISCLYNYMALLLPFILFLAVQYIPLFVADIIPFVGPGGILALMTFNLLHIIGVLLMIVPLSTWFYQLTGKIYTGAALNAFIVTWMLISSQVIAPVPV
jgi:pimeloyl-ACP methyl ester carboxylesterase